MDSAINWPKHLKPLMEQYGTRKHPLDYKNRYQLVVMVILSAQDADRHINELSAKFFDAYPTMSHLAKATPEELKKYFGSVKNFMNKGKWLVTLAQKVGEDDRIPSVLKELTELPGIGRKSANVTIRESGGTAEGIIVDLHVIRVAQRLGIASSSKPEKIEKELMGLVPHDRWNEVGMALSFLGRELCRPTHPKCALCVMNAVCRYYTVDKEVLDG